MSVWEERAEAQKHLKHAEELLKRAFELPHHLPEESRKVVHKLSQVNCGLTKTAELFAEIRAEVERALVFPNKVDREEKNLSDELKQIAQAIRTRREKLKGIFEDDPWLMELERCLIVAICRRRRDDLKERLEWARNIYTNGGLWPPFRSKYFPLDNYAEQFTQSSTCMWSKIGR